MGDEQKRIEQNVEISVIVPVYNVEKCVKKCIDSILQQSFSAFELILINDGSKDSSGEICEAYAKRDKRIVLLNQMNQGASQARNRGLECAKGNYILFIDSDDYIDKNYMEELYLKRSDLTMCGIEKQDESGKILSKIKYDDLFWRSKKEIDYVKAFQCGEIYSPYCKLFRKDIIRENEIRYPREINWGEDGMFVCDYLQFVNTIQYISYVGYHYVKYESSNTLSTKIREDIIDMITISRKYCIEKMKALLEERYPYFKEQLENNIKKNCAEFTRNLLNNQSISSMRKIELLKKFMCNSYVMETVMEADKWYSVPVQQAFRYKSANSIVYAYSVNIKIKKIKKVFFRYMKLLLNK